MTSSPNKLDPLVLSVLSCPSCDSRPGLSQSDDSTLVCDLCKREYAVIGGIPRMVVETPTAKEEAS